ncbi:hypothetical protein [Streptomyces sp. NPDC002537]
MSTPLRDGNAPTSTGIPPAGTTPPETPADPVKALLHHHRDLCVRAVDPLEIAAVLEARGIADRAAADCRHRDVFALSEELYARVRREDASPGPPPGHGRDHGGRAALRTAPPAYAPRTDAWWTAGRLAALWLVAYALLGDPLLTALLDGRPAGELDLSHALSAAAPTALALACAAAVAVRCAHRYTERVRHVLLDSRTLDEFRTRAWPALVTATGLFLGALLALLWALHTALDARTPPDPATPLAAATALGVLLFLARLTALCGHARAAAAAVLAACAAEAVPLLGAWLTGGAVPPAAAGAHGAAVIPLVACAAPALALLAHALPALSRASAHRRGAPATGPTDPAEPAPPRETPARRPHPEPHTPSEEQGR